MTLRGMMFAEEYLAPPGQLVVTATTNWTVPLGVRVISMVCVQQGGDASTTGTEVVIGGVTVCRAKNGGRIGDGGGDGGAGWPTQNDGGVMYGVFGAGGAGGYTGNGGRAGNAISGVARVQPSGGGGGAGGSTFFNPQFESNRDGGASGGVGLLGQGANGVSGDTFGSSGTPAGGTGGSGGTNGQSGNQSSTGVMPKGGSYGGCDGSNYNTGSGAGGANAWKNAVSVTPGQVITITVPANASATGAVRLMWGGDRSYPNNAGNL